MPTNVIMPQMGESIAEGTLTKWLKKPGDAVKRDEPLFEISTDKVDAEIPSPGAGTLLEILVPEGQTVPINTVVARLAEAGEAAAAAPAPAAAPPSAAPGREDSSKVERAAAPAAPTRAGCSGRSRAFQASDLRSPSFFVRSSAARRVAGRAAEAPLVARRPRDRGGEGRRHLADSRHGHLGPRDEAGHRGLPGQPGSAPRLRRPRPGDARPRALSEIRGPSLSSLPAWPVLAARPADAPVPARARPRPPRRRSPSPSGSSITIEPMSAMRKKIAQRMVESKQTSAHVTTVFEIDYSSDREAAQPREGPLRAAVRHEAVVPALHPPGDGRGAQGAPSRERLDRRRRHRASPRR